MRETIEERIPPADVESEVIRRYAAGAAHVEEGLCCASGDYDAALIEKLPAEIVERDYGCGDPSRLVEPGETVLDLGSGAGKICYILSQKVGPEGSVIGVDFNDAMLSLARKHLGTMEERLGFGNVRFVKGKIQDLALDLERVDAYLDENPVRRAEDLPRLEEACRRLRREEPMIADDSVDVVVSNCVLNLVRPEDKGRLFREIHRVLRRGGRAVISDVVCDEPPTARILEDPELWSGCISGAFVEGELLARFEEAGFYGIEILARQEEPWQVIDGIEFRSMTVRAFKGKEGPCLERHQAVVYRGPWASVRDDDGHLFPRGRRIAVCEKTYRILTRPEGPYARDVVAIEPRVPVPVESAAPFDCRRTPERDPRVTKGADYREDRVADDACCDPGCC